MHTLALTLTDAQGWLVLIVGGLSALGTFIATVMGLIRQGKTTEEVQKVGKQASVAAKVAEGAAKLVEEVKTHQEESVQRRDEKLDQIHEEIRANTKVSEEAFKEAN